ncbi:MAG: hypothetical protein ABIO85_10020 [Sphingomicrobium sp.]
MSAWHADLAASGRRATIWQGFVAWIANPGFALACHYRLAHWAVARGRMGRGLAMLVERRMIAVFACHLSARARIGPGVCFPHPLAIVIGEGVVIGARVTIYHGVTLGRQRVEVATYPLIGEEATLYCGATLLGAVTVGDGVRIGAQRLMLGDEPVVARPDARVTRR